MSRTRIDWCDHVWNPVTGCTPAGAGCRYCYAARMFSRLAGMRNAPAYYGRKFGDVAIHEGRLDYPATIKKPSAIFVCSMGDLFHRDVPTWFIRDVVEVMSTNPGHTFIVLTKRINRASAIIEACYTHNNLGMPENVVLGISVSNHAEFDRDVPILLTTPAMRRIVSAEPILGPISTTIEDDELGTRYNTLTGEYSGNNDVGPKLDGVIVGGCTGPNAPPMHADWARQLRDECATYGTPFFFKQWGEWLDEKPVGKKAAGRLLDGREHNDLCWEVTK